MDTKERRDEYQMDDLKQEERENRGGKWLGHACSSAERDKKNAMKDGEYPDDWEARDKIGKFYGWLDSMLKSANKIKSQLDEVNTIQGRYDQGFAQGLKMAMEKMKYYLGDFIESGEGF